MNYGGHICCWMAPSPVLGLHQASPGEAAGVQAGSQKPPPSRLQRMGADGANGERRLGCRWGNRRSRAFWFHPAKGGTYIHPRRVSAAVCLCTVLRLGLRWRQGPGRGLGRRNVRVPVPGARRGRAGRRQNARVRAPPASPVGSTGVTHPTSLLQSPVLAPPPLSSQSPVPCSRPPPAVSSPRPSPSSPRSPPLARPSPLVRPLVTGACSAPCTGLKAAAGFPRSCSLFSVFRSPGHCGFTHTVPGTGRLHPFPAAAFISEASRRLLPWALVRCPCSSPQLESWDFTLPSISASSSTRCPGSGEEPLRGDTLMSCRGVGSGCPGGRWHQDPAGPPRSSAWRAAWAGSELFQQSSGKAGPGPCAA